MVAKLMGYKFEINYKPGKENRVAGALSRRDEMELCAVSLWQYDELDSWEAEISKDERLASIWQQVITNNNPPEGFSI